MKNIFRILTLSLGLGFFTSAHAGLMIEPYVGYEASAADLSGTAAPIGDLGKVTGAAGGLRLGYKLPVLLWAALDYKMTSGASLKYENSVYADATVDSSDLFFDVGVDLPIIARLWAGYGLSSNYKVNDSKRGDATVSQDSVMKVGLGLSFIPFVSINFEYFTGNITELESKNPAGTKVVSGSSYYNKSHTNQGLIASISIPLNL